MSGDETRSDDVQSSWFGRLPVARKLALNAALPLVLVTALSLWDVAALNRLTQAASERLPAASALALEAQELQRHVVQVQQFLSDVSATRAQDGLDDGFEQARTHREAFRAGLVRVRELLQAQADRDGLAALERLSQSFDTYYQAGEAMAHAYVDQGPAGGNPLMPAFDQASLALQQQLDPLVARARGRLDSEMAALAEQAGQGRLLHHWMPLLILGLMAWTSWRVGRAILIPLRRAVAMAETVAEGDLSQRVRVRSQDEAGQMLQALNRMCERLGGMVAEVQHCSQDLASASTQIRAGNEDLATRTVEHDRELHATVAALQAVQTEVDRNAQAAERARGLAQQTHGVADLGVSALGRMHATMQTIVESSRRMGDMIGLIQSVAFQTNLLALNAAVEAARAGEQGRGFAVVAAEVRQLAQRTSEASADIQTQVEASSRHIDEGRRITAEAVAAIQQMQGQIHEMSQAVQAIWDSSASQGRGLSTLAGTVDALTRDSAANASLVEQTSQLSSGLAQESAALDQVVGRFRLTSAA